VSVRSNSASNVSMRSPTGVSESDGDLAPHGASRLDMIAAASSAAS
jgi:hypothetical protein